MLNINIWRSRGNNYGRKKALELNVKDISN
jgi:hypothetical protein